MLAIAQLNVSGLELIPEVILVGLADCNDLHVDSVNNKFFAEVIPAISGLQHDLDDAVDHIAIGEKTAAEAESDKGGLLGVVGCDIPVTDGRNRVYSPIK